MRSLKFTDPLSSSFYQASITRFHRDGVPEGGLEHLQLKGRFCSYFPTTCPGEFVEGISPEDKNKLIILKEPVGTIGATTDMLLDYVRLSNELRALIEEKFNPDSPIHFDIPTFYAVEQETNRSGSAPVIRKFLGVAKISGRTVADIGEDLSAGDIFQQNRIVSIEDSCRSLLKFINSLSREHFGVDVLNTGTVSSSYGGIPAFFTHCMIPSEELSGHYNLPNPNITQPTVLVINPMELHTIAGLLT